MSSSIDSHSIIRLIFQLGYFWVRRARDRVTTLPTLSRWEFKSKRARYFRDGNQLAREAHRALASVLHVEWHEH